MPTVTCPSCGERGTIPGHFVGTRIKCRKCGVGFTVTGRAPKPVPAPGAAPVAAVAAAPAASGHGDVIAVEGLDDSSWSTTADDHSAPAHEAAMTAFVPHEEDAHVSAPEPHHGAVKQYKILTPKDKVFENRFDLARLEEVLNRFAKDGWCVRSMATPQLASFTGEKEEFVILLER